MRCFAWGVLTVVLTGFLFGTTLGQELSESSANRVEQLNQQIDALNKAEKWAEAHEIELKVLQIFVNELGDNNIGTAGELKYAADQLFDMDRHREAKPLYNRAIKAYVNTVGVENEDFYYTCYNYSQTLRILSEIDQARIVATKALPISTVLFGTKSLEAAEIREELGQIEFNADNLELAKVHLLSAIKIYDSLGPEDRVNQVWALSTLGSLECTQGNTAVAEKYLAKAEEMARAEYGDVSDELANVLLEQATLVISKGDYPAARKLCERVQAICQELGDPDGFTARLAITNLALIYTDLGDYVTAEEMLEKLYRLEAELLGEDTQNPLYTLFDLGYLYEIQDKYSEAREKYVRSLEGFRRLYGDEYSMTLALEQSVASVDHLLLKYDDARKRYHRVLDVYLTKYGEDSIEVADLYWSLGWLEHDWGDYEKARDFYDKSLDIFTRRLGSDHPDTINLKMMRSFLAASEEDWKDAFARFDAYERDVKVFVSRILASLSPTEQILFLKEDEDKSLIVSMAMANQDDPQAIATTANWLLNSKGVAQESLAARETLTRDLDDETSRQIAKQLLTVRQELASLALSKPEEGKADQRKARIAELSQQEETLGRQLADRVGKPLTQNEWIEIDAIRGALAADQTMVNIFEVRPYDLFSVKKGRNRFSAKRYFAYIIPPAGKGDITLVDLGGSIPIDEAVSKIRSWIADSAARDEFLGETPETDSPSKALFADAKRKVWDPIAKHLPADTKQLVLCPDGALWLMPWNTIPTGDDHYLIEDYSIRFLTSGRELVLPKQKAAIGPPLLFADPSFDLSPDSVRTAVQSIFRSVDVQQLPAGAISRTAIPQVAALPSTRLEALAISPSVTQICGKEPVQYLGKFALETVAKEVKSPRVLVLSTHGFFLPEQSKPTAGQANGGTRGTASHKMKEAKPENPLLRCGLLLAGCNNPTARGDDGILTGMEILGLDLRGTELVVLSACETGVGKVNSGEGVAGLRQAFQLAGAQAIVSTLWQVPDRDSALLMRDFFQNMSEGQSHSEALRQAQIQRIEARRKRYGAAHPFYWAAWTVTGT